MYYGNTKWRGGFALLEEAIFNGSINARSRTPPCRSRGSAGAPNLSGPAVDRGPTLVNNPTGSFSAAVS